MPTSGSYSTKNTLVWVLHCPYWNAKNVKTVKCTTNLKVWRSEDRASWYILIIKPTRCTNFSNLFWNRTLLVSGSFSAHHQESSTVYTAIGICHTGFADCLLAQPSQTRSSSNPFFLHVQSIPIFSILISAIVSRFFYKALSIPD